MMFEDLLDGYLDGSLGGADQSELFHILAVSDEKRQVFNQHTRLRSMLAADHAAAVAPTKLAETTLLAALGALPFTEPIARTANWVMPMIIAAGVVAAGVGGYMIGRSPSASSEAVTAPPIKIEQPAPVANPLVAPSPSAAPMQAAGVGHRINTRGAISNLDMGTEGRRIAATDPVATSAGMDDHAPAQPAAAVVRTSETRGPELTVPADVRLAGTAESTLPLVSAGPGIAPSFAVPSPSQFELELTQGYNVKRTTINDANIQAPTALSLVQLHVGMRVASNMHVGVMGGQNAYALVYDETAGGIKSVFSQYTALAYGGAYGRLELPAALGLIPSASLGAGASMLGPVGEVELSVSKLLSGSMRAYVGFHASGLWYRHASAWFSSQTESITAGLAAGF